MEKLLEMWNAFSKQKKVIAVTAAILALVFVVGGGVLLAGHLRDRNADAGTESSIDTEVTEVFGTEEVFMTEMTEVTEETEMEVIQTISVTLSASSIEKDLKIKILDENDVRIKGQPFVITVTPEGASEGKEYNDHDMDGIIYMKSMTPGNYTVQLHDIEGYIPVVNPITATVKEQIVYEKVEIKNEIKKESEINVSQEEAPQQSEPTVDEIKDTIPYLQSSAKTDEVAKDKVDMSVFADASVSEEKSIAVLTKKEIASDATETVLATAEISVPKKATIYTAGKDSSKTVTLQLNFKDDADIIKDIQWQVDGATTESSDVVDCVVAEDKMSAELKMKSAGTVNVSVVVTYEESVIMPAASESSAVESEDDKEGDSANTPKEAQTRSSANTNTLEQQPQVQTNTGKVTCEVTVGAHTDDATQLKDVDGNVLFIDKDATQSATPKNYETVEKFYTNPKYIGWQKFDGKVYYYKEDHTYATGKQIIGGVEYEFDESGYLITKDRTIGIDVSKWQGKIDWEKVANAEIGIDFAIIRCGYRGISSGSLIEDKYFKQNIEGATKNGIKVGVYFYSQAITKAEAIEEASMALELVKGYNLQLPIYIDTEGSGGRGDEISKAERTEILKTFCEVIKNAGYKPGVYSGAYWFKNHVNASEVEQYHIWVAQYNKELSYKGRYDIWQYTSSGKVPGINGNVDMDIAYRPYY